MAVPVLKGPTTEKGIVSPQIGMLPTNTFIDKLERTPKLMYPLSVWVYRLMLASDAQVKGLYTGTVLPLTRFWWGLDPNGAKPEVVDHFRKDYGLPVVGDSTELPRGRLKNRFSWRKHLPESLKALGYGHYGFEQVGEIGDDGKWHIRKLAARPPWTVDQILQESNGSMKGIKQAVGVNTPEIPISQLLWYVWDMEGDNWPGTSLLRSCYRNWLLKEKIIRVDAQKLERNGMGVPWATAPEGASKEEIEELNLLARRWRSGDYAGGAGPHGSDMKLKGVEGQTPDTVKSWEAHNSEMGRNFLMMFMDLAQGNSTNGSYALSSEFRDVFTEARDGYADWVADTFTEHMLEDDCDWNFGPEEQCPRLVYLPNGDNALAKLANLVEKELVKLDPELEDFVRQAAKLPAVSQIQMPGAPSQEPQPPDLPEPAAAGRRNPVRASEDTSSPLTLPQRQLRRQPYEHEVQAAVDFAEMDFQFTSTRDILVAEVQQRQQKMIQELADEVVRAGGDLEALAAIACEPGSEDVILLRMQEMADKGVNAAASEAEAQGVSNPARPNLDKVETLLASRAKAVDAALARSLSEAASRKAIKLTGATSKASDVAASVKGYMEGLSNQFLKDELGGALNGAMNTGRKGVMGLNEPKDIYASELLDENTCPECASKDGTEYEDLEAAESDYPTGGYSGCRGGSRCRGTLVATYGEV